MGDFGGPFINDTLLAKIIKDNLRLSYNKPVLFDYLIFFYFFFWGGGGGGGGYK